jgi:hypothetical protein
MTMGACALPKMQSRMQTRAWQQMILSSVVREPGVGDGVESADANLSKVRRRPVLSGDCLCRIATAA